MGQHERGLSPRAGGGAKVRELLDKRAIHDVLMRHSRGTDQLDAELLRSAFHDNALILYPGEMAEGGEGAHDAPSGGEIRDRCVTYITNEFIELDGDQARCESYWRELQVAFDGEASAVSNMFGRYIDRFERRAGEWRIVRRVVVVESNHTELVTAPRRPGLRHVPQRSRDDLSYSRRI